jgi:hypothetical protein
MIGIMGMRTIKSRVKLIYRMYLAVALFFITNLFSLYRLSECLPKNIANDRLVAKKIRW